MKDGPLRALLGDGEVRCKVLARDVSVHWYPAGARAGTPCLCGGVVKQDDDDTEEDR